MALIPSLLVVAAMAALVTLVVGIGVVPTVVLAVAPVSVVVVDRLTRDPIEVVQRDGQGERT